VQYSKQKKIILGNGPVYHSTDRREYEGLTIFYTGSGNLTRELVVFKFSYRRNQAVYFDETLRPTYFIK